MTLLLMLTLIGMTIAVSWRISQMEEQACWEVLHQSVRQLGDELEVRIRGDQELLDSIADIIAARGDVESEGVQTIIDGFRPNTMLSHIALLLPGDRAMLPGEPVRDAGGVLSFEKEAALGRHISGRSVDIRDESRLILRSFVPVVQNGETVAMLYGVADLKALPEKVGTTAYGGQAAVYIADGATGDFLVDTWHDTLGNIRDLGKRESKSGSSQEQLWADMAEGQAGYCSFESKSIGEDLYFYYEPVAVSNWSVALSVPESLAFAGAKRMNALLIGFNALEMLLLGAYFLWLMGATKRELAEKQKLAERDMLTGLLNRNSYEKNVLEYPGRCRESVTCIYVDVNGLHTLNDSKGHAAGDEMLRTVAGALRDRFDEKDVYRIGGDEFVVFARDEALESIRDKLGEAQHDLTERGYHVSVGLCRQERPVDMDSLVKEAETHMYAEKDRYYQETGEVRRS